MTQDPNFKISDLKGPRDMSSMASGETSHGKLMITSDLEHWLYNYKDIRGYVAIIDMSNVNKNDYYQVGRGFGNEFFVKNPNRAKVVATVTKRNAIAIDRMYDNIKPNSEEELEDLYDKVWDIR